ncbi:MAG: metalloregulator ArsR/SmtB family transcription factor [Chloroflexota bacterium]|jgi:DNA-binding transcriptional ArsR family regulator|nr:metalloregulator ArsR/SmtB family transcription factor [Chloroflexota bacterium]
MPTNSLLIDPINVDSLSDEAINAMAESFKALADPTRLRLLALLFVGERSVGDLADHLDVSQSAISHQLRILRSLDIVRYRKDGREVYYTLADEHVRDIFTRTLEHIIHD